MDWKLPYRDAEKNYEDFLLGRYAFYYEKPMPTKVYRDLFGKEPPVSIQALTDSIPDELRKLIEEDHYHP